MTPLRIIYFTLTFALCVITLRCDGDCASTRARSGGAPLETSNPSKQ